MLFFPLYAVNLKTSLATGSEERQKSRAEEFRSRSSLKRSFPQSMRRFLWPDAQRKGCGWLAKAQATAQVDVPIAQGQCCGFFIWIV